MYKTKEEKDKIYENLNSVLKYLDCEQLEKLNTNIVEILMEYRRSDLERDL